MRDEKVKLIIEISKDYYEILKCEVEENQTDYYPFIVIGNGIPLDDIDSDETRAYFDGQAYGWEEGRKDLCDKISAEIKERIDKVPMTSFREDGLRDALEVVEKYKKEGAE